MVAGSCKGKIQTKTFPQRPNSEFPKNMRTLQRASMRILTLSSRLLQFFFFLFFSEKIRATYTAMGPRDLVHLRSEYEGFPNLMSNETRPRQSSHRHQ